MTATVDAVNVDAMLRRANREFSREAGEQVLSDYQLAELGDTIREHYGEPTINRPAIEDVTRDRDEQAALAEERRLDLEDKRAELGIANEVVESLRGDVRRLQEQLTTMTGERNEAFDESVRLADELAALQQDTHECRYPLEEPGLLPGPCECGREFPLPATGPHPSTPHAADAGGWTALFARIRDEIGGGR